MSRMPPGLGSLPALPLGPSDRSPAASNPPPDQREGGVAGHAGTGGGVRQPRDGSFERSERPAAERGIQTEPTDGTGEEFPKGAALGWF